MDKYLEYKKILGSDLATYKIYEGKIKDIHSKHQTLLSMGKEDEADAVEKEQRRLMKKVIDINKKE